MRFGVLFTSCLILSVMILTNSTSIAVAADKPAMVFLGDSNTASNHWKNGSYVTKLNDLGSPWQDLSLVNSGRDGWGAYSYYNRSDRIQDLVIDPNPKYLLIALGGNDFLIFRDVDKFRSDYHYLLNHIIEKGSSLTQIYLANIYWGTLEVPEEVVEIYLQYQEVIANASVEYGLPLIDFYNTTVNHEEYYQSDAIHLNEGGHKAIALVIDDTIGGLIQQDLPDVSTNQTDIHTNRDTYTHDTDLHIFWILMGLFFLNGRKSIVSRFPEKHDS